MGKKRGLTAALLACCLFLFALPAAAESRPAADVSVDAVAESFPEGTVYVDLLVKGTGFQTAFNAARAERYGIREDSEIAGAREDGFVSSAFLTDLADVEIRPELLIYFELTARQREENKALCDLLGDALSFDPETKIWFCDESFFPGTREAEAALALQRIYTGRSEPEYGYYATFRLLSSDPETEIGGEAVLTEVRAAYLDAAGNVLACSNAAPLSATEWNDLFLDGETLTDWDAHLEEAGALDGDPFPFSSAPDVWRQLVIPGVVLLLLLALLVVLLVFRLRKTGAKKDADGYLPAFVLRYDKKLARYLPPAKERRMMTVYLAGALLFLVLFVIVCNRIDLAGGGAYGSFLPLAGEFLLWLAVACGNVALHELGHVIAGRASGYRFVSVRCGPAELRRTDGGLRLRLVRRFGLEGQTVMEPPALPDEEIRLAPYYLGGSLVNSLTAVACGLAALLTQNENLRWNLLLVALMAAEMVAVNLIPGLVPGKNTDGTQLRAASGTGHARAAQLRLMRIAAALYAGRSLREMDASWFPCAALPPETLPEAYSLYNTWDRTLTEGRFRDARAMGALLTDDACALPMPAKAVVALGNCYCELLTGASPAQAEACLTDVQKRLLHRAPYQPFFAAVKHGYELFAREDPAAAAAVKTLAQTRKTPGLLPQVRADCLSLIARAEERYQNGKGGTSDET